MAVNKFWMGLWVFDICFVTRLGLKLGRKVRKLKI
jgi:hypothetical protein